MSQNNADIIRGVYEAFAKGDIPAVLSALDPGVEWNEAESFIYADGNPYIGPDAVLEGVFQRLGTEWDGFTASPHEVLDAGDTVVTRGSYGGIYKQTGNAVRAQFAHVFRLRYGKIVAFQQYTDTLQFHRAVTASAQGSASAP